MFSYIATLILLGAAPPCGPLDVDTAVVLAAERSDEVAIKQAERAAAAAEGAPARAVLYFHLAPAPVTPVPPPVGHGDILHSEQTNRSLGGLAPFGRIDVQVVQPLYTWGRLDAASEAADAGTKARQELMIDTVGQVQLRVTQLFWGVAVAKRLLGISADVEKALGEADKRISDSLKSGDGEVSPADKFRVDLFRSVLRGREAEAEKGLDLARIGLAATLRLPPAKLLLKDEPLDPVEGEVPDTATVLAPAERQRSALRARDEGIRAREAEVKSEQAAMKPQFFVTGLFGYAYAPNRTIQYNPWVSDPFNFLTVGAAIGVRQDLAFPSLSARARKAIAEKAILDRQRAGLARLVQVQVDSALADLRAARARLVAARAALGSGKSLFRSVGLDFAAGLIEARDLIESYTMYVESQVGAAQAAYDFVVSEARLAQVAGEPPRKGSRCELE